MSIVPGLGGVNGGGFPLLTGFGPTNIPGGFSNTSFGTPGITGFGFPPPFVDPNFFFIPSASSFFLNMLLGASSGQAVPINFGPIPSTLGFPPFLLGFPFFGGTGMGTNMPAAGGQQALAGLIGTGGNGAVGQVFGNPFGAVPANPFGGLNGVNIFGGTPNGTGIPGGQPGFGVLGGFGGFA